jgi:hypothetical protein
MYSTDGIFVFIAKVRVVFIFFIFLIQLIRWVSLNRIPVMALILAPILGVHSFRGHISLKHENF